MHHLIHVRTYVRTPLWSFVQVGVMKPGHVFTIEPMINASGSGQDVTWPDNWTAVRHCAA